jgi:hypothetical protein
MTRAMRPTNREEARHLVEVADCDGVVGSVFITPSFSVMVGALQT